MVFSKDLTTLEEQDDSMFKQDRNALVHFISALWYTILAHTDIVCYIMVFINQVFLFFNMKDTKIVDCISKLLLCKL